MKLQRALESALFVFVSPNSSKTLVLNLMSGHNRTFTNGAGAATSVWAEQAAAEAGQGARMFDDPRRWKWISTPA